MVKLIKITPQKVYTYTFAADIVRDSPHQRVASPANFKWQCKKGECYGINYFQ